MNRSNSWKNLEKTFAIRTNKSQSIKKTKLTNSIALKSSVTGDECKIDDSDEENIPLSRSHSKINQQSKIKRKSREILTLNTTINSSVLDSTRISSSDTDDEIDCEPELHDVSDIKTPQKRLKRNRFQSLTFLSVQKLNHSTPKTGTAHDTPNSLVQSKQSWSIKRNAFNNNKKNHNNGINKTSINLDETIIESDSTDDLDEKSPPKKCRNKNGFRPLTMDDGPNVIIDTQSTQQSIKIDSPTNFTPKDKKLTKLKGIKGGLLERLTKAISRSKSDYSFWMNERSVDLIEPGDKLCITKIEQSYGKILLYCSSDGVNDSDVDAHTNDAKANANADNGSAVNVKCDRYTKVLCLDPAYKRLSTLQVGKTIEVVLESTEYVIKNDLCFHPYLSKILS